MRSHFDYDPRGDRLIPSQEAGLQFKKGDILRVLNQDDSFWWQVSTDLFYQINLRLILGC